MKQKLIMIFTVTAIAVLCASVFAGCGEGDKNSEATTTPSSTAVQPTTAKSTLPKNTATTGVNGASSQASAYNPAAEPDNNNDGNAYNQEAQSSADNNVNGAANSSPQSSAEENSGSNDNNDSNENSNNNNNNPEYPEIPGEGEIVIHGDKDYVGAD